MKREAEQDVANLETEVKAQGTKDDSDGEPADKQMEDSKRYPPKTRIALITGYNGSEFSGSQKNPDVRTVEEEIEKALHKLGCIADYNFGDLKKIAFNRATRTDKRVHAL